MSIEQKLHDLCQAVKVRVRAVSYSELSAKCNHTESGVSAIAGLMKAIQEIKDECNDKKHECNEDKIAFFQFYFEQVDFEDKLLPLFHLAKLVYPEDVRIGIIICKKFRNPKIDADAQIAKLYGCKERKSQYIIANGRKTLTALLNQFINTEMLLAHEIEQLLMRNAIIKSSY